MNIKLYLTALSVFFATDMLWLGIVARKFYAEQLAPLLRTNINWVAGILFYLLFIVGLVVFVITPALEAKSVVKAAWMGALFGFICYATYDLTNLATLRDWPILITVVDMIWGAVLAMIVSSVTVAIAQRWFV